MYKHLVIDNFRAFSRLEINNLERVNLIAGVNNIGKTALLEAIFLHAGAYQPELGLQITALRGIASGKLEFRPLGESPWDSLFHMYRKEDPIKIIGDDLTHGRHTITISELWRSRDLARINQAAYLNRLPDSAASIETARILELSHRFGRSIKKYRLILDQQGSRTEPIPPTPAFPTFFITARSRIAFRDDAEKFGALQILGDDDAIMEVLRLVDSRLKSIEMVVVGGEPILHGDIGLGRLIPLPLMGEGIVRVASIALHLANARNGVVLIDEFENGIHHSALIDIWRVVGLVASRFNVQLFATTHSRECILSAHRAFSETLDYPFALHRLERIDGDVRAVTYDKESLELAIEMGLEMR